MLTIIGEVVLPKRLVGMMIMIRSMMMMMSAKVKKWIKWLIKLKQRMNPFDNRNHNLNEDLPLRWEALLPQPRHHLMANSFNHSPHRLDKIFIVRPNTWSPSGWSYIFEGLFEQPRGKRVEADKKRGRVDHKRSS